MKQTQSCPGMSVFCKRRFERRQSSLSSVPFLGDGMPRTARFQSQQREGIDKPSNLARSILIHRICMHSASSSAACNNCQIYSAPRLFTHSFPLCRQVTTP